jgi:predicted metalloprotease
MRGCFLDPADEYFQHRNRWGCPEEVAYCFINARIINCLVSRVNKAVDRTQRCLREKAVDYKESRRGIAPLRSRNEVIRHVLEMRCI